MVTYSHQILIHAFRPPALISILLVAMAFSGLASDWPQFLGPTRNGVYTGPALTASWPKEGPHVVWQRKVGAGFSGPAVASGKLILFHRVDNKEIGRASCRERG